MSESVNNPDRFFELRELANQARATIVAALAIQSGLESDSREVATSILGSDVDDVFGDEWPLTYAPLADRVKDVAVAASRPMAGQEKSYAESPTWPILSSKYNFNDLTEVYETDDPVTAFAVDLLDWSEQMAERGWPMLLEIELAYMREGGRGEVSVYADTPEARQHLAERSGSHNAASEEDIEDGESERTVCYQLGRGHVIDYQQAESEELIKAELEDRRSDK